MPEEQEPRTAPHIHATGTAPTRQPRLAFGYYQGNKKALHTGRANMILINPFGHLRNLCWLGEPNFGENPNQRSVVNNK